MNNMNSYTQREEKIELRDDVYPERHSPFYNLTSAEYINVWKKVTNAGERYARANFIDDGWFDDEHDNSDQHIYNVSVAVRGGQAQANY